MEILSIIIPCYNDKDIQKTVDDIRAKAKGNIEIIVVLDGIHQEVKNAIVLENTKQLGMRASINKGVKYSKGKWLMKCDAHCVFDEGFDIKVLADIKEDWIVIPRRYKLDTDKWEVMDEPPIDYMKLFASEDKIGGVEWKRPERESILIDETMVFQGSCWFMSRAHWNWLGELQEEGYGTFTQEPIELALKTWLGGGKVMVNKKTWYAHKHRKFGRTTANLTSSEEVVNGNKYSKDFWVNNRWDKRIHNLDWLPKRFNTKL
jgi:glycosyltransferase involved in cell wall biosynthesis